MNITPELTAAEQKLNAALMSFNIARLAINTTLSGAQARGGAVDRLISHADEYGVEHTLAVLDKDPASLNLPKLTREAAGSLRQQLQTAYDANHALDRALGVRENLLRAADPKHMKAINVAGQFLVFDPVRDSLHERDTGKTFPAEAVTVSITGDMDTDSNKDRDR